MTNEHLRILLSNPSHFQLLFRAAEQLARGDIPAAVVDVVRLGRMIALQKPDGGVRGIVVGDVLRRLVGRTIAQQVMSAVKRYTAPFQYALKTRAGTECVAHMLQALTEADPNATVFSNDGIRVVQCWRPFAECLEQIKCFPSFVCSMVVNPFTSEKTMLAPSTKLCKARAANRATH